MPSVPSPLAAAIGLLDGVRKLPSKAAHVPGLALTAALQAKSQYDELAERGEQVVNRWRGNGASSAPAPEAPKAVPTPPAPTGSPERVETAATPDVVETVEAVAASVDAPEVVAHDDLPLADYDHLTLGSLRGRIRSLTIEELVQLRDYERAHAHRLPVVTLLDNRIAKLATDASAEPSPGGEAPVLPKAEDKVPPVKTSGAKKPSPPRTKVRVT